MSKVVKIVVDAVVSFVFFIIAAILLDWVGGKIFGTRIGEHGNEVINVNGGVMVAVTLALTAVFAVWFYKFLTNHKFTKVKDQ
jgi:uncharacterized BrkB/YihY/UPF0761 family membrane protein